MSLLTSCAGLAVCGAIAACTGLSEHTRGFVDGLIEAQLKVYGCNFIADALTDRVIREITEADPDFYRGGDTYTDTGRYLTAHQYIGIKLAAVERERTLNRRSIFRSISTPAATRRRFPKYTAKALH